MPLLHHMGVPCLGHPSNGQYQARHSLHGEIGPRDQHILALGHQPGDGVYQECGAGVAPGGVGVSPSNDDLVHDADTGVASPPVVLTQPGPGVVPPGSLQVVDTHHVVLHSSTDQDKFVIAQVDSTGPVKWSCEGRSFGPG